MQRRLLLNVVVGESAAILKLLAGEDQALLVWGNALLICRVVSVITRAARASSLRRTLDLGLHIVDGV